jgi:hypothetical protein
MPWNIQMPWAMGCEPWAMGISLIKRLLMMMMMMMMEVKENNT